MNLVKFSVHERKLLWVGPETFCHKHVYWTLDASSSPDSTILGDCGSFR